MYLTQNAIKMEGSVQLRITRKLYQQRQLEVSRKLDQRQGKVQPRAGTFRTSRFEIGRDPQKEENKPPVTIAIGLNASLIRNIHAVMMPSDEELLYGDYCRWLAGDEMAQDRRLHLELEITPEA